MTNTSVATPTGPSTLTAEQIAVFPIRVDSPDASDGDDLRWGGRCITWIGVAVICVGAYFILFGPDTVSYSAFSGPNFKQFLQLYPGPIATLGFLCASGGNLMQNKAESDKVQQLNQAIERGLRAHGIAIADLGDTYRLGLEARPDNQLAIVLLNVDAPEPGEPVAEGVAG